MKRFSRVASSGGAALLILSVLVAPAGALDSRLNGQGESFAQPALEALQKKSATQIEPFTANYTDVGESPARLGVATGGPDYAVSATPLTKDESAAAKAAGRTVAYAPFAAGEVAVAFALDEPSGEGPGLPQFRTITHLKLTVATLARIFTGVRDPLNPSDHVISEWSDPEILSENADNHEFASFRFINSRIQRIVRVDSSSSTAALISLFLSDPTARRIWNFYATTVGSPPDAPLDVWPPSFSQDIIPVSSGSIGVMQKLLFVDKQTFQTSPGTGHYIAYVAPQWAKSYGGAPLVAVQNKQGNFVQPSDAELVRKVNDDTTMDPATNLVTFDQAKIAADPAAYPGTPLMNYLVVPTTGLRTGPRPATGNDKASALAAFIRYAVSDPGQKDVADSGYGPVTAGMQAAGVAVAGLVDPQPPASPPTTISPTSPTSAPTTGITALPAPPTTGTDATLSGNTNSPSGGSPSAGGATNPASAQLPFTGAAGQVPLLLAGLGLLVVGQLTRRRARRSIG